MSTGSENFHNDIGGAVSDFSGNGKMVDGGERISYGENAAIREPTNGKGRYDLITPFGTMRLAKWYELGGHKYSPRNWEKGMPFSRYVDSAKRHIDKFVMGMTDEDHLAAAVWNLMAIMHHQELGQLEFDDMPHYMDQMDRKIKKRAKKHFESTDVLFETYHAARVVVDALAHLISVNNHVTVREFLSLAHIEYDTYPQEELEKMWRDLKDWYIEPRYNGFVIATPLPQ